MWRLWTVDSNTSIACLASRKAEFATSVSRLWRSYPASPVESRASRPILVRCRSIRPASSHVALETSLLILHPWSERFDCAILAVGIVCVGIGRTRYSDMVSERAGSRRGDWILPYPIFVHQRQCNEPGLILIRLSVQYVMRSTIVVVVDLPRAWCCGCDCDVSCVLGVRRCSVVSTPLSSSI